MHDRLIVLARDQASLALTKNILISDPIDAVCVSVLERQGYTVKAVDKMAESELVKVIKNYDGLIVRSGTQVTKAVIEAGAPRLRLIGRAGSGVDNIDAAAATQAGVLVMNTPGGNTTSAAELTVSLLMALSRDIPRATNSLKGGKWERKKFMGAELEGKTIGVVGLGQIGRRVASICNAMGMRTLGYDPLLSAELASKEGIQMVPLAEIYKNSDFITLHTPLTSSTRNLLNATTLAQCKKGVRLINCARGGIINEADLLAALNSGHVAGAALDVFESEPPPASTKTLLEHPNVVCTPHLGASTEEAQEKVARDIALQFVDLFEGRAVRGVVNSKILATMYAKKELAPFVELAERIGALQAQIMSGKIKSVTLATRGDLLKGSADVIQAAVLKGILSRLTTTPVNVINAPSMAKSMGLVVAESHESKRSNYGNEIRLSLETESGTRSMVGTVTGAAENDGIAPQPRIVRIDDYAIDLVPEGNVLFFRNTDRPGMIGRICSILGGANINVGSLAVGRKAVGDTAIGVVSVDQALTNATADAIKAVTGIVSVHVASLPSLASSDLGSGEAQVDESRPPVRPKSAYFSSGPCAKRPGYSLAALPTSVLGRSHRSKLGLGLLRTLIADTKRLLQVPDDYLVGVVPGSDTGAFEMAMWGMLGPKPVDVIHFESFGTGWAKDAVKVLKLPNTREFTADYGKFPDVSGVSVDNDIIFTMNGTTSGVCVPYDAPFLSEARTGITMCDATSAVFAQSMPWSKLDVTTFSWQKALGGEGAHGMLILSPRAVQRIESFKPSWPIPKIMDLRSSGKLNKGIFTGSTINTPSMLAVEDCLDALRWVERDVGGLGAMITRAKNNLAVLESFVAQSSWLRFLAEDPRYRSNTSVCLKVTDMTPKQVSAMTDLLEAERVAYDIGSYRDAPPGLRIWCGATVQSDDLLALCEWLEWAHAKVLAQPKA